MVMAEKQYNREAQRALDNVRNLRCETYFVKKWQAAVILLLALVMVVGFIISSSANNAILGIVGLIIMITSGLAIVGVYAVIRLRGMIRFYTYYARLDDGEVTIQAFSNKHFRITSGTITLECKKNAIYAVDELYRPEFSWNWFEDADFTSAQSVTPKMRKLTCTFAGKPAVLSLHSGELNYAEVCGIRMRYTAVSDAAKPLLIPSELYRAALKAGIAVDKVSFIAKPVK